MVRLHLKTILYISRRNPSMIIILKCIAMIIKWKLQKIESSFSLYTLGIYWAGIHDKMIHVVFSCVLHPW